jgi:uncharacterized YigZ family protein
LENSTLVPAGETRAEIHVLNSRFVACAGPAASVEDARAFIARIKSEFPDATHHVPAFVIGSGASVITHSSDDGEPSGTAGRPALTVLQGSGLGDVVVVVVRYFGGTKLGTGGLVRAYQEAVRAVLAVLPRGEKTTTVTAMVELPYSLFERARQAVAAHRGEILDESFTERVTLAVRLRETDWAGFQADLVELSRGQVAAEVLSTDPGTIFPI